MTTNTTPNLIRNTPAQGRAAFRRPTREARPQSNSGSAFAHLHVLLLALFSLAAFASAPVAAASPAVASPAELWIAPNGDDTAAGTQAAPLRTLDTALRKARDLHRLKSPALTAADGSAIGVRIVLRAGFYTPDRTLFIRPEDSGKPGAPTIIEAAPGETPVISGGVELRGWKRVAADNAPAGLPATALGKTFEADAPLFNGRVVTVRQLWLDNGKTDSAKLTRARTPNGTTMDRIAGWDRKTQEAWIPASTASALRTLEGVDMTVLQQWEIGILRLSSLTLEPDGKRARVTFHQPESKIEFEHPWPQPIMDADKPIVPGSKDEKKPRVNAPFFLAGAVEFLDAPGEFWQSPDDGRVYYWPRDADEANALASGHARIIAPALETVFSIYGTAERPVEHLIIRGIQFSHTAWMRPAQFGHVPLQAGMPMIDAYKLTPKGTPDWRSLDNQAWIERLASGVTVRGANNIRIERCRFEHMAASGLDFISTTHDNIIEGNVFRDIGGNGLQMGFFQDGAAETHLPYDPADMRDVCQRERIANNLFTDCANEDWGSVGIAAGFVRETTIEHNELNNLSYTAISLGWGWTRTLNCMRKNLVRANHIHHIATRMADTGGIYTLSAQPGTIIERNAIHDIKPGPYAHDPDHWSYIYLDEGSSFMIVRDNWCPEAKFQTNANGPGNIFETNGPAVSDEIKAAAGLQPVFRDLK